MDMYVNWNIYFAVISILFLQGTMGYDPVVTMKTNFTCREPEDARHQTLYIACGPTQIISIDKLLYGRIWPKNDQDRDKNVDRCQWVNQARQPDFTLPINHTTMNGISTEVNCGQYECLLKLDWSDLDKELKDNRYKGNSYFEVNYTCSTGQATDNPTLSSVSTIDKMPEQSTLKTLSTSYSTMTTTMSHSSSKPSSTTVEERTEKTSTTESSTPISQSSTLYASTVDMKGSHPTTIPTTSTEEPVAPDVTDPDLALKAKEVGDTDSNAANAQTGAIAGAVIGAVGLVLIMVVVISLLIRNYRKKASIPNSDALYSDSAWSGSTLSSRFNNTTYSLGRWLDSIYNRTLSSQSSKSSYYDNGSAINPDIENPYAEIGTEKAPNIYAEIKPRALPETPSQYVEVLPAIENTYDNNTDILPTIEKTYDNNDSIVPTEQENTYAGLDETLYDNAKEENSTVQEKTYDNADNVGNRHEENVKTGPPVYDNSNGVRTEDVDLKIEDHNDQAPKTKEIEDVNAVSNGSQNTDKAFDNKAYVLDEDIQQSESTHLTENEKMIENHENTDSTKLVVNDTNDLVTFVDNDLYNSQM